MKLKLACVFSLCTLFSYYGLAESSESQFLARLHDRLISVQAEITRLRTDLTAQGLTIARQKELRASLELKLNEQSALIETLSNPVDEQAAGYRKSLLKWKIGCVSLGIVSIAAGAAALTMMIIK